MPTKSFLAFPGGPAQLEENYSNFILDNISSSVILDQTFPSDHDIYDHLKMQPEVEESAKEGESVSDTEERWLKEQKFPYMRFLYNPEKKLYMSRVSSWTPQVVGDKQKERKEVVDETVTGSTRDELLENYINTISLSARKAMDYSIKGLSKEDLAKLNAYDLYWIDALKEFSPEQLMELAESMPE
jgi:hypothetical protein